MPFKERQKSLGLFHLRKRRLVERTKIMEAADRVDGELPYTKSICSGPRGHLVM